jgi:hypothetical protein
MIIYRVKVVIKKDVEKSWLEWMKKEHINDVMKTGYFLDWEMQKLLLPEIAADESSCVISYKLLSLEQYDEYLKKEAPRLQKEHKEKFSGKYKASRAVYQLIIK